jgi:hypothetical protein
LFWYCFLVEGVWSSFSNADRYGAMVTVRETRPEEVAGESDEESRETRRGRELTPPARGQNGLCVSATVGGWE